MTAGASPLAAPEGGGKRLRKALPRRALGELHLPPDRDPLRILA